MKYELALFNYEATTFRIPYSLVNHQLWLKGKDIATTLGYNDKKGRCKIT